MAHTKAEWGLSAFVVVGLALMLTGLLGLHRAQATCDDACTQNLKRIGFAVVQYEQDYDERLPQASTQAEFQAALSPYGVSPMTFTCPDTGQPFTLNLALSGHTVSEYPDPGRVEVVREDPAPANQPAAILFLDGHVERGGVETGDPALMVVSRANAVSLAVLQYTQDNDEIYPPMHNPQEFQSAIRPYLSSRRSFVTPSGADFVPNSDLSGRSVNSITDPHTTILFREPAPYTGGLDTAAYADGHVERGGIVPLDGSRARSQSNAQQLALAVAVYTQDHDQYLPPMHTPQEFQSALIPYTGSTDIFSTGIGSPFIPNPALSGVSLAEIADPTTTILFQDAMPYDDGVPTVAYVDGHIKPADPVQHGPPRHRLLWNKNDGRIALWTLDGVGGFTQTQYGPFSGWAAQALASGPDQIARLLWTRTDGAISTWAVDDTGSYTHQEYGPYSGWTAHGLVVGPDNAAHLLWTTPESRLSLWRVDTDGTFTHQEYGPYPEWTAQDLSVDTLNQVHVLWTNTNGKVSLWEIKVSDEIHFRDFGPYPGWSASALASDPEGYSHLLWSHTDGTLSLWTTGTDGTFGHQEYGPYPNWAAQGLTVGGDRAVRVLWSNTDGMASLWNIGCAGVEFHNYGPYPGWIAQSLNSSP